jgi:lysozyme
LDIISQLLRDEGFRPNPYKDTRGFLTVGVGHNLDANPLANEVYPMSVERAKEILASDVARMSARLQTALPWVTELPDVYAGVLTNMAFNMGVNGLLAFHHTLAAFQNNDWAGAASGMQSSQWYTQVGARAQRLVVQVQTGEWQ